MNQTPNQIDKLVDQAVMILEKGRGHLGVINLLVTKGYEADAARKASYDLFDKAKSKLMKQQLPHLIIAWTFIGLGVIVPIALFLLQFGVVIISALPILIGVFILYNQVNPKRLPILVDSNTAPHGGKRRRSK